MRISKPPPVNMPASRIFAIGRRRWILGSAAPEVMRKAVQQVEMGVPVIGHSSPPIRDVSGTDQIPVARFPALARTHRQRDGGGRVGIIFTQLEKSMGSASITATLL